jgi:AcrR family transcriptional regulator
MLRPVTKREGGGKQAAGRLSRLPPGRHGLSRDFVSQNQRDRITAGIIAAVAEHGYQEATISEIAAAAGVSRRTFYAYFASKDECFFETFDLIADHVREAATAAAAPHREWPDRVRARLGAVLDIFAANPNLARFVLIAPPRAGSEVAERYRRAMEEVLAELTEGMPAEVAANQPSRAAEHGLIGGAAALVVRKVEAGEGGSLPELLPDLLELTLIPYLGRAEAARVARGES